MVNWSASMQQTFEFYIVDPDTWKDTKKITTITSCQINRDSDVDTLGSASFEIVDSVGECYIRVYLVTVQNGVTEKHPLGTFLATTPSSNFDGRIRKVTMDAYTPLLELTEKSPPIGYYLPKNSDVMEMAYKLMSENMRGEISKPAYPSTPLQQDFIASLEDDWLSYLKSLIAASYVVTNYKVELNSSGQFVRTNEVDDLSLCDGAIYKTDSKTVSNDVVYRYTHTDEDTVEETEYYFTTVESVIGHKLGLDGYGRVLFLPDQKIEAMSPVWVYTDDNSSILHPEISMDHDLYGIPNVVEVVYIDDKNYITSRIVNDDPNSPTSTVSRGREIVHREMAPSIHGIANLSGESQKNAAQKIVDKYAEDLLSLLSSVEYTISYTHGYCPVRLGDCVLLNYKRAGLKNIKAKVISQSIKCQTGCSVSEKAVFTHKLWR